MSSIEWLEDRLNNVKPTEFCSIETIKGWVKRTKEMNRKEIVDAFKKGQSLVFDDNPDFMGHRYYNETFTDTNKKA